MVLVVDGRNDNFTLRDWVIGSSALFTVDDLVSVCCMAQGLDNLG